MRGAAGDGVVRDRPSDASAADGRLPAASAPAVSVLRVLTVNIHKGFSSFNRRFVLLELRDAVRAVGADIVFLQEVQGEHEEHRRRWRHWPVEPHYEFLADQIWPEFAYGRNAVYPHGHHGNAVLSKFPIVAHENHDVSVGRREARGLLRCVIGLPGQPSEVHAICVHLGLRERQRREQLLQLVALVEAQVPAGMPLVVAGDFNDWRRTGHAQLLRHRLAEVHHSGGGRLAASFPAQLPLLPLDRIYVRNVRWHRPIPMPRRPWSGLSDHAPLAAELML